MVRRRTRRRSRKRGGSRGRWRAIASAALVVVALAAGAPSGALDVGVADRTASVDVVGDIDGAQKLNVTSELEEGSEGCLVRVTNNLGQDVTVNVSLRENSTGYGTLRAGLLASGDSVEFNLADGETQTVNMDVNSGTAGNTTYFHVNSTGSGVYAETLDRSAPINASADTSCA